jgi:site-specific recombinase XerD
MRKPASANLLGAIIRDYFTDHLPRLRGSSPHTIHSYRDSIALLLRYVAEQRKAPVAALDLADLDIPHILAFLSHLEDRRKNGVATRNVRLAAIHAFFRFVASRNPEQLELAQKVIAVPFKRAPSRAIDYLEYEEIDSILKAIDRTTLQGTRDYALLATMFNTGGRVQEIVDLRVRDLQLIKPFQVRLFGKGKKEPFMAGNCRRIEILLQAAENRPFTRSSSLSQPSGPTTEPVRSSAHSLPMPGRRLRQYANPGEKTTPSSQHAAQHSRCASQVRRRSLDHQPHAGPRESNHDEPLCEGRSRDEAEGHREGHARISKIPDTVGEGWHDPRLAGVTVAMN